MFVCLFSMPNVCFSMLDGRKSKIGGEERMTFCSLCVLKLLSKEFWSNHKRKEGIYSWGQYHLNFSCWTHAVHFRWEKLQKMQLVTSSRWDVLVTFPSELVQYNPKDSLLFLTLCCPFFLLAPAFVWYVKCSVCFFWAPWMYQSDLYK